LGALPIGESDVGTFDPVEPVISERGAHDLVTRWIELGPANGTDVESRDHAYFFG
jgi:hypothetical protein